MKPNEYRVLQEAVEAGVRFGLNRAFKHTDMPTRQEIEVNLEREIMTAVCEWFQFEDVKEDNCK